MGWGEIFVGGTVGKQNEGRDNVGKDDGDRESIYVWGVERREVHTKAPFVLFYNTKIRAGKLLSSSK